uniref:Lipase n=1 Tax=Glossina pallidipes TaxID=7398 RepID=A0A1A9ZHI4_GLOPL
MEIFNILMGASLLKVVILAGVDPTCHLKEFVTTEQRIRSHGYPAESHFLETSDGYVLNIFRIPYSPRLHNQKTYRPTVLLQHGLFSNSDCWLNSGPNNSLAYLLADAGYDVWLGNARGNIYSRNNTRVSVNNPSFWHFDWHEIGINDISGMIDFITNITSQSKIHYVGHSQGTTVYFVLMSERPEYNNKIKSSHLLAPCAYFGHGTSFVFDMLTPLVGTPGGMYNKIFEDTELLPQNDMFNRFADTACSVDGTLGFVCKNLYLLFIGAGYQNTNTTSLQVLIETHPAGSSSNQVTHFLQLYVSRKFRKFDWGEKRNMALYGQTAPPDYNLSKLSAPVYLYSANKDGLCDAKDVDKLVANLPPHVVDYRVPDLTFNHLDFIVAYNMKELVNEPVLRNMYEHEIFTYATN